MEEVRQIVIKEDWKGEAIKAVIARVGYGITIESAQAVIQQITDSVATSSIRLK